MLLPTGKSHIVTPAVRNTLNNILIMINFKLKVLVLVLGHN